MTCTLTSPTHHIDAHIMAVGRIIRAKELSSHATFILFQNLWGSKAAADSRPFATELSFDSVKGAQAAELDVIHLKFEKIKIEFWENRYHQKFNYPQNLVLVTVVVRHTHTCRSTCRNIFSISNDMNKSMNR